MYLNCREIYEDMIDHLSYAHNLNSCNVILFTHGTPRSSQELVQKCLCIPGSNWNLEMLVFNIRRGENRSARGKTSRSREENQQQTRPIYDAGTGNRTQDTLVGGERSHHYAIPAPHKIKTRKNFCHIFI